MKAVQQPSLPPLTKGSTTYKLYVPRKVEEKIRYLIRKFPSTEWSGVLFYNHTGKFEDGSLEIHCEDIFPMDLGSGTFTDFKMDESVVGYIAENIDLFGCDTGLVHSHHSMGAFISGTDSNTIREEGNDTNCFVSLVVDTKGTYVAALTRKIKEKKQVTTVDMGSSYEFFGEGSISLADSQNKTSTIDVVDKEIIEYFMLDVEIEHVNNPLAYLDTRFEEIQKKKKEIIVNPPVVKASENNHSPWIPNGKKQLYVPSTRESLERGSFDSDFDEDYSFRDWQNSKRRESAGAKEALYASPKKYQEQTLFTADEMDEMIDTSKWTPDPTIIHKLVCQMITCSLIVNDNIDLKQWITRWMNKKYEEIFGPIYIESLQFDSWKEFIVEFLINQYNCQDAPGELDPDFIQSRVASAMYNEIMHYRNDNIPYLEDYLEVLTRYTYE